MEHCHGPPGGRRDTARRRSKPRVQAIMSIAHVARRRSAPRPGMTSPLDARPSPPVVRGPYGRSMSGLHGKDM
jgi:hypothetical protein